MAMIRCQECGKTISARAELCPSCGAPLKKKRTWRLFGCGLLGCGTVIALLFVLVCAGLIIDVQRTPQERAQRAAEQQAAKEKRAAEAEIAKAKQAAAERPPADITIDAPTLIFNYKSNEVASDARWKGKILEVTGEVDGVGRDLLDYGYVTLKSGEQFGIFQVQCFFPKKRENEIAPLSPGQRVVVRGRCDGKFGNVLMKDCYIP